MLNCDNGIVNLQTAELIPHTSEYLFTTKSNIEYNLDATCAKFEKWLKFILQDDPDKYETILDYMAYAISGVKVSNEKFLLFTGGGANGKSVLAKIMGMLMGDYFTFTKSNSFMNFGKEIVIGSRMVAFEELPKYADSEFWEEIKDLSSGGVAVINRKFKKEFRHPCWAKFLFICNELPYGTDSNEGFYRRFLIIKFNRQFKDSEKINGIENQFQSELPGILNLLIKRMPALIKRNFTIESKGSVLQELEGYKVTKDFVLQYSREQLGRHGDTNAMKPEYAKRDVDGSHRILLADLYKNHFKIWCEDTGIKTVSCNVFTKRLKVYMESDVVYDEAGKRTWLYNYYPRID